MILVSVFVGLRDTSCRKVWGGRGRIGRAFHESDAGEAAPCVGHGRVGGDDRGVGGQEAGKRCRHRSSQHCAGTGEDDGGAAPGCHNGRAASDCGGARPVLCGEFARERGGRCLSRSCSWLLILVLSRLAELIS